MPIAVFSDLGGEGLLGKARELADESGDRVVALCSSRDSDQQQRLIYLGADEVVVCHIGSLGDWMAVISQYITSQQGVRLMIFPSTPVSNVLMGMVYGEISSRISPYLEAAEMLSSDGAGKKLDNSTVIQSSFVQEKTALLSVKKTAVGVPFEDSSRFGKIRNFEANHEGKTFDLPSEIRSSSNQLLVLVGAAGKETIFELANRLAKKYGGTAKKLSGKVEVVYSPCLVIEVNTKLRELPEFNGELLSISSRKMPISAIVELSLVTPEIDRVLENLTS
jgi:hypothetical protein